MLCRSASPCDDQHGRAVYADTLMGAANVKTIIDLADNDEKLKGYIQADGFNSPNFLALYEKGGVVLLSLNMDYESDDFKEKLVKGLTEMAGSDGPYLVHCTEGKDRTGFVCMLLEALCGASYQEIVDDYMLTYDNYYGITSQSDPEKYDVIVKELLEPMVKSVAGGDADLEAADLAASAEAYLKNAGMSDENIEQLRTRLTAAAE